MFVKSLRLAGFKSFADPSVLEFEGGINIIVGPNGSGKSNISDALQWVMGTQAPSSLRSESMEDVIFAGSQERPRLGFAEVALTIGNEARRLPLDLNEITISRSTDRNGNSEYRINGAPCRLLDITELLSDAGVGRSIHTIVSQGQLDAVLEARPEDRRGFIEEAAQIGKFRRRKDRALRKIERVDDNLMRLNDVLEELKRSIRPLKRQASAAAAHSELVGEHRRLRQMLASTDLRRLDLQASADEERDERRREQLLQDELESLRAQLGTASRDREARAETANESQRVAFRLRRVTDLLNGMGRLARERAELASARLAAETEQGYRERIRLLGSERVRWQQRLDELATERDESAAAADSAAAAAAEHAGGVSLLEQELAEARTAETASAEALVRAEGMEAAGRSTVGAMGARVRAVEERRDVTRRTLTADFEAVQRAEREVKSLEADLDAAAEVAAAAELELELAREETERVKDQLAATGASKSGATARADALDEVYELLEDVPEARARIAPLRAAAKEAAAAAVAGEKAVAELLAAASRRVEEAWQEVARYDADLRRLDALLSAAADRLAGAKRQTETRETELAALDDEIARARDALAEAERAAAEESAHLPAHRASVERAREESRRLGALLAAARNEWSVATRVASERGLDARAAEERALAAALRLEEAEAGIADAETALAGLAARRQVLETARMRATAVARVADDAHEQGGRWTEAADRRAAGARAEAVEADRKIGSMRQRESELARNLEETARKRNEADVRRAESRARAEAIIERAMDEWGLGREDLEAIAPVDPADEETTRARAEQFDREIRRLGPVNPRAAEEYRELAEREDFLVSQMDDLRSSRRDLLGIVREVDSTIRESFEEAFYEVAAEFDRVMGILFPGGHGALKLTDPDDLLTTGIEIEARPPGKNVKKLSLLSGGERSLVALAFLFSIFRTHPSPFYLLDEVEAALDDVNLSRFLTLVADLQKQAQIMIVTHQKRTMEAADVLYGVSMSRDGVSHVVAKRLVEVSAS